MDQLHKVLPTPSQTPAKSGSDRNLRAELVQLTSRAAQDEQRREASSMANSLSSVEPPSQRQMDALWTLWERMAAMFPGKFTRDNGTAPAKADGTLSTAGQTWATALRGLTARQLGEGLSACLLKGLEWPPGPAKFRALCLNLPTFGEVEQQMRPGRDRSAFAMQVRAMMDLHTFNTADGFQQERMLRAAYEQAMRYVAEGGKLPEPMLALPHERPTLPVVSDREKAKAAMARAAADLGFGDEGQG